MAGVSRQHYSAAGTLHLLHARVEAVADLTFIVPQPDACLAYGVDTSTVIP